MLAQAGLKSRLYDMSQLFQRKPIADLIVDEADSSRALKRVLGAGIFGAIGTVAAGQVAADGTVVHCPKGQLGDFTRLGKIQ